MTLEEFERQVINILKDRIQDTDYINNLRGDIERTYNDAKELEEILGYSTPSPSGYAFGIFMLYPDYPPSLG